MSKFVILAVRNDIDSN